MAELTAAHRDYLAAHAVDPEFALTLGVQSAYDQTALPNEWQAGGIGRRVGDGHGGILFPWTSVDGRVNVQLRPDDDKRPLGEDGEPIRYLYQSKRPPVLWAVRWVENPVGVLIPEGSKQSIVAAQYAPEGWAVLGMAGCWGFSHEDMPVTDLEILSGLDVVVGLDADAGTNYLVWLAGTRLDTALKTERVKSRKWLRLPAGGKSGLDDLLARRTPEKRASYLAALIEDASEKVADRPPKPTARTAGTPVKLPTAGDNRAVVVVNEDRLTVINSLTAALVDRFSGSTLFNHGEVISELKGAKMAPVDRGRFNNVIQQAARTLSRSEGRDGTSYTDAWPEDKTMAAVLSEAEKFTPLDRVATTPFVRPDGSICTTAGYDEATRSLLIPDEVLARVDVPETPTATDVEAARDLLLDEWLGDFPFGSPADRANILALILTPFVRSLVPLVPLAVVDGTGKGVGKNLLADCLSILFTGQRDARPMPYTTDDQEHRKVITAAFREGSSLFFFDEAHHIEGANFARAITSMTYQDRILGVSRMAEFPNRVTWVSLGNNVQVEGDMVRRVYRIRIDPKTANPEDRPSNSFRHPGVSGLDLRSWTEANRAELLRAVLVLVRAWFVQGQPKHPRADSFGSFEVWETVVGGVCGMAGVEGFLGNLKAWRGTSDFRTSYWSAHFEWLFEQFGNGTFFATDVKDRALRDPAGFLAPPENEDPAAKSFSRVLGQQYAKLSGQWFDGLQVVRTGTGKGERVKWAMEGSPQSSGGSEGSERSEPSSSNLPRNTTPVVVVAKDMHARTGRQGGSLPTVPTLPTPASCRDANTHDPDWVCPTCGWNGAPAS